MGKQRQTFLQQVVIKKTAPTYCFLLLLFCSLHCLIADAHPNRYAPTGVPVVNAGADTTISLPATTVSLTGSTSDANGTIVNYSWTKVSGPDAATISQPDAAITTVTNLVLGTYVFRLTVTDNAGGTAFD